jgi:hypothetical protein
MRSASIILALSCLGFIGCDDGSHGRPLPPAPDPIDVPPFAMGAPDAVLLVTGSTHAMMEVCNCSGPMPGGLARRSGLVISYRKQFAGRCLLIDTGDVFGIRPEDVRNRYVLKGYRQMGYDAVALADQEWAASSDLLAEVLVPGETAWLSTTITLTGEDLPLAKVVRRQFAQNRVAVISDIRPDAFLFFDQERRDELAFMPADALKKLIDDLQAENHAVIAVVHGSDEDIAAAAERLDVDVILRGHIEKSAETLGEVHGTPVVKVGGSEHVGVLALRLSPDGEVTAAEYRLEVVNDSWPLDKRMLELYQAYAHEAMRLALDAERKEGFDMVPSASCGKCHPYQYKVWKDSPHAKAYASLQRVGRTTDPNCVGCHTLGFGLEGGFYTFESTPELAGVQCQSCHRIGYREHIEDYTNVPKVTANVCTTCHTPVTDPEFEHRQAKRFHDLGCGPAPDKP